MENRVARRFELPAGGSDADNGQAGDAKKLAILPAGQGFAQRFCFRGILAFDSSIGFAGAAIVVPAGLWVCGFLCVCVCFFPLSFPRPHPGLTATLYENSELCRGRRVGSGGGGQSFRMVGALRLLVTAS